jgi:hypothetical protein
MFGKRDHKCCSNARLAGDRDLAAKQMSQAPTQASPSPVPPYLRVVDELCLGKLTEQTGDLIEQIIPMPVSLMVNTRCAA